jgi:AraC family transcriptional regulator of adaptative response / DNA-3-methyladenine glycosylase II
LLSYLHPVQLASHDRVLAARAIRASRVAPQRYRSIRLTARRHHAVEPVRDRAALAATIEFPDLRALPAILARIRSLFDLESDVGAIEVQLAEDPHLAKLVAARPGLRVPGALDPFELAVRAVLGQQVTVAGARRLAGALVAAHGELLATSAGEGRRALPALTGCRSRSLAPRHASGASRGARRARRGRGVRSGLFDSAGDLDVKVARLRRSRHREWTAQYGDAALREADAFPAADVGLLRAMTSRPRADARGAPRASWRAGRGAPTPPSISGAAARRRSTRSCGAQRRLRRRAGAGLGRGTSGGCSSTR